MLSISNIVVGEMRIGSLAPMSIFTPFPLKFSSFLPMPAGRSRLVWNRLEVYDLSSYHGRLASFSRAVGRPLGVVECQVA